MLDTLRYLRHETDVWFEITTLLIPGHNDSDAEIEAECAWILDNLGPDVPLHFTAFHPDYKMTDVPPTPPATLTRAREIALRHGLRYVYTGNVHDTEGGSTFCPGCGRRSWCATGTACSATGSPTPAPARPAAPWSPGCTTAPPATGARAGFPCSSAADPSARRCGPWPHPG